jgi:hypothetical protein
MQCGEPFRFIGVACGVSDYRPMVSVDALELRAPLVPNGRGVLATAGVIEMAPRES